MREGNAALSMSIYIQSDSIFLPNDAQRGILTLRAACSARAVVERVSLASNLAGCLYKRERKCLRDCQESVCVSSVRSNRQSFLVGLIGWAGRFSFFSLLGRLAKHCASSSKSHFVVSAQIFKDYIS